MDEKIKRYVIRRSNDGLYFNGVNIFFDENFENLEKAKVYKNITGVKVACKKLVEHQIVRGNQYEIVEITIVPTDNVIKYKYD